MVEVDEIVTIKKGKDIHLTRIGDTACANVKHLIKRHSPDGFEWGYNGSGPADLALNILTIFAPEVVVDMLYQSFKFEVISSCKKDGCVIYASDIVAWIEKNLIKLGVKYVLEGA